jgi:hypothetical protein
MPLDNTAVAQRISDNILSADDGILAISIMDIKGKTFLQLDLNNPLRKHLG